MNPISPTNPQIPPEQVQRNVIQNPQDPTVTGAHHHAAKERLTSEQSQTVQGQQHPKSWKSHFSHLQTPSVMLNQKFLKEETKRVSKDEKKINPNNKEKKSSDKNKKKSKEQKQKEQE